MVTRDATREQLTVGQIWVVDRVVQGQRGSYSTLG